MLSLGLALRQSGGAGVPYDPAAQAIFDAWPASTPAATKTAVNDAVVSLKALDVGGLSAWDAFDILYPFGAAREAGANLPERAASSRVNWKNPGTFDCIAVNAPIYDDTDGTWRGDGATARLRTQWIPAADAGSYALDNASAWGWSLSNIEEDAHLFGVASGSVLRLNPRRATNIMVAEINDLPENVIGNSNSTGFFGVQRTGAAIKKYWRDGVQVGGDLSSASTVLPTAECWVLGQNASTWSTRRVLMFAAGASFDGFENDIYTIFGVLFQAVGAIP